MGPGDKLFLKTKRYKVKPITKKSITQTIVIKVVPIPHPIPFFHPTKTDVTITKVT